ncbi:MAG: TlpA family protein disulfide reductase [Acidimicrobiia bacterium]
MAAVPGSLLIRRALNEDTPRRDLVTSGPAPAFQLETTDGVTVSSADFAGRPAIVHFFGSWCEPCREGIPVLAAALRRHANLAMVGVIVRDDPAEAYRVAREAGITWPLLVDPDEEVARAWGVDSAPVTFFVSGEGRISGQLVGQLSLLLVDRQLDRIL